MANEADIVFMNDLTALGARLMTASEQMSFRTDDYRATSLMLNRRLWSHHRGFVTLWKAGHTLEGAIILRSGIEAAICISANYVMRDGFYPLLKGDLAATLKGAIKHWRADEASDLVVSYEEALRHLLPTCPVGPTSLNMRELADSGGQKDLYGYYKWLSMTSTHVTGLSLLSGVVGVDDALLAEQVETNKINQQMQPMMMAGASTMGFKLHAAVVGHAEIYAEAEALEFRLNDLTIRFREPSNL